MTVRRRRRPGSDRLVVSTPDGLPLGHLDLVTRTTHDVPTQYSEVFRAEVDAWLDAHGRRPLGAAGTEAGPGAERGAPAGAGGPDAGDPGADAETQVFPRAGTPAPDRPRPGPRPRPDADDPDHTDDTDDTDDTDRTTQLRRPIARGGGTGTGTGGFGGLTGAFTAPFTRPFARADVAAVSPEGDLAAHLPGHGLVAAAAAARASGRPDADRPHRLRIDGRHAVADALDKLTGRGSGLRRPRWRILHGIPMAGEDGPVLLDHLVVGPGGIFVVEVAHRPGAKVVLGPRALEIDREDLDLAARRRLGEEVATRIADALAVDAGAERTLNPPAVTPVIAVVGAVLVGRERPPGVLVARVGQLPRLLQAFGTPLTDVAVTQIVAVARRPATWTP